MSDPITTSEPTASNCPEEISSVPCSTRKRRLTSKVWDDFDKVDTPDGVYAICKHCKRRLTGSSNSGTSYLNSHLKRCPVRSQGDISQLILTTARLSNFKFNQERSRVDLAKMIIKHEYSFNMVEHNFFRAFVYNLNPEFKFVTRNTIRSDIMKVYNEEKEKLYKCFDKLQCRISLTTDMWTSDQNIGYCCLTAHYIDERWVLQKKIIGFLAVECPHDAETLSRVVMDLVMGWNVDKKLFSITVDNASANDLMLRDLRDQLYSRGLLPLGGQLFHVRCSAHILNLIVQDGLREITSFLQKIRESCKYVRSTPNRKQKFQNAINQCKLQDKKGVSQDAPTKWNSTYTMLESAVELKEAFIRLEHIDRDYRMNPDEDEWKMGEKICDCLKLFYDATNCFSGTSYPTSNMFFVEICEVYTGILEWERDEHSFLNAMAQKMKVKFLKYWDKCNLVLAMAIVLDPRFKIKLVRFYYDYIYGTSAQDHVMKVEQMLNDLYLEYASEATPSSSLPMSQHCSSSQDTTCEAQQSKKVKRSKFDTFLASQPSCATSIEKSKLQLYLEEDLFPREVDFNILSWWRMHSGKFPILSKVARDILAIPVSTVASESAFSTGGRVLDSSRCSMLPEIVQALVCAQDWLDEPDLIIPNELAPSLLSKESSSGRESN